MAVQDQLPRLTGAVENTAEPQDGVSVMHWLELTLRAALTRKRVATGVFLLGVLATAAYYRTRDPVYRVYTTILAQRPQALPSPARSPFGDVPAQSAWEMIHRRDNLVALVKHAGLAEDHTAVDRARLSLRDRLDSLPLIGAGAPSPHDPVEDLVLALDKRLLVQVQEGTITISLEWPDPQQAYAVVEGALENFIEARHLQEVTAIDEVISVLRARVATLHKELQDATAAARRQPPAPVRTLPAPRQPSEELVRLQTLLAAKQRALQDVEDFRRRRLAELQLALQQSLNTLSEAHPTVIAQRQEIAALMRDSPQVETLREEERRLRSQYAERAAREGTTAAGPVALANEPPPARPEEDPRVRDLRDQYEQMYARVSAAQVELDAARTAFKYRYNVVWPPQLPREPWGPNPLKIFGAGLLASIALAVAAAAAPDVIRGRVLLRWQVERKLRLPVLGEVDQK